VQPRREKGAVRDGQDLATLPTVHCKKRLSSLVSDIPAGDGKNDNLFYSVVVWRRMQESNSNIAMRMELKFRRM
jgi:hypothetical protein